MHPPWSMIFFTTVAGAAQGLLLALVGVQLYVADAPKSLFVVGALVVLAMSAAGLAAATFHLGHPMRAWRAAAMWRTSWLSREVIVLPAFMAATALWGASHWADRPSIALGLVAALLALVLYLCTSMIYGAVKAIREWAHPITPINFLMLGLASGLLLAALLASLWAAPLAPTLGRLALLATLLGAATRGWALWRNLRGLAPKTTLQSALGVRHPRIVLVSHGSTAGHFGTREFMHGRAPTVVVRTRWAAAALAFVLPALMLAAGASSPAVLALAAMLQYLGLLAERWSFFAEGQHPQNLYLSTPRY
jgi:sulfite dehydrogenase (quinone) subunit SoeC